MVEEITPIILTYNESPNIKRTLDKLIWAKDIIVVDSFSDDDTLEIISQFPQVRVFQRKFDSFSNQFNFALRNTNIVSEWVLALGADHILTAEFIDELKKLKPGEEISGYQCRFIYYVFGRPLRTSIYPPKTVLFRWKRGKYSQDGHHERPVIDGKVLELRSALLHDDRKPLARWLSIQHVYAAEEANKLFLSRSARQDFVDRVRSKKILAPFVVLLYCLFIKGLILDGLPGIYYSFQRMFAELLVSLHLIDRQFRKPLVNQ